MIFIWLAVQEEMYGQLMGSQRCSYNSENLFKEKFDQ
mgnify:CR=1 FL=1